MDLGLQGKKAILVGAARGIGMATAEILAREGCDLAITARSEDSVKDAVADLEPLRHQRHRQAGQRQEGATTIRRGSHGRSRSSAAATS